LPVPFFRPGTFMTPPTMGPNPLPRIAFRMELGRFPPLTPIRVIAGERRPLEMLATGFFFWLTSANDRLRGLRPEVPSWLDRASARPRPSLLSIPPLHEFIFFFSRVFSAMPRSVVNSESDRGGLHALLCLGTFCRPFWPKDPLFPLPQALFASTRIRFPEIQRISTLPPRFFPLS